MDNLSDKEIIESWSNNATSWISAIREKKIQSRIEITNQSIIESIKSVSGKTILDIGCGEGWLVRELSLLGYSVSGLDVVPELVDAAKKSGADTFYTMPYEEISEHVIPERFDLAVCNFSLLGKESTEHVIKVLPSLLNQNGCLIIQTLNPRGACGDSPYKDGWRVGSWVGFSESFCDPAPWFFRTTVSWLKLLTDNGFEVIEQQEPINSVTEESASLILVGRKLS